MVKEIIYKIISWIVIFGFFNNGAFLLLAFFNPNHWIEENEISQSLINSAIISFCLYGLAVKFALDEVIFKYFRKRKIMLAKKDEYNLQKNEQFELQTVERLNYLINKCKDNNNNQKLNVIIEEVKKLSKIKNIDLKNRKYIFDIELTNKEYNFLLVTLKTAIIKSVYKMDIKDGEKQFYLDLMAVFMLRLLKDTNDERYIDYKNKMEDIVSKGIINKENSYGKHL